MAEQSAVRRSKKHVWSARLGTGAVVAVLTVVGYLAWLGWDQHKDRIPGTSNFEGPYQPWQVLGLAVTLAAIAVAVAWRDMAAVAIVTIPVVLTVAWSIDAADPASGTVGANMWPIGQSSWQEGAWPGAWWSVR